jgi:hypothetical protein
MLADVRPLRRAGKRLARDEIMATPPRRGDLTIFKRADPWSGSAVPVAALLGPDQISYQLPPLDQVRIARWRGSELVLVGLEELNGRKAARVELQSWWVQLISPAAPPQTAPPASTA